jgi:tRNA dimethylallyltransferase
MRFIDIPAPLILLVGPTAVGKTELSIRLAERLDAEIISADSRLFYRGMDIGTAKPSLSERRGVPHHLIDVADPDEIWSLAMFQQAANQTISAIHARGKIPMLVGGTGQYIRSVTQGWAPPAQEPDERLRTVLERIGQDVGPFELHRRLTRIDPCAAGHIEPQNLRRTVRALEVILKTGRRFSDQRQTSPSPYSILTIGINRPRPELYQRIDARIQMMLDQGFQQEVQTLLARGYSPDLPNLSAIGYREMIAVIQGKISLDEAIVLMKRYTRQFVRRQANWFKSDDPTIHWFDAATVLVEQVEEFIQSGEGWSMMGENASQTGE